ncbi:MAG: FKBP-type peptidyl-prolyl cis-trans isomerase [Candidatus Marinimicrobia bacterium]|nr:FKBP-type peptidyl-prolyl cis-trans isomerase [Candidatus Neomarinimicrobiota bacterium]
MKRFLPLLLLIAFIGCSKNEGSASIGDVAIETHIDSISYSIGMDIATSFTQQSVDVNPEVFVQGFTTKYKGDSTLFNEEEMRAVLTSFRNELRQKQQDVSKMKSENNKKAGDEFLVENGQKDGVVETESGLQYKVLTSADGPSPVVSDKVTVHYTGRLLDGSVFDSSVERGEPASFRVDGVIKGWTEALQLMRVGEKWELYIPGHIAYAERGSGGKIGPNQLLIFEVELLGIE